MTDRFVYTEKGLVEIWRSIYCELEEEVQQAKLRRDLKSDSGEFRTLRDFVIFSLRNGLEELRRKYPDKIIKAED